METGLNRADRLIIDQLTEGVVLLDPGLCILHCNPSFLDLLEGSPEDLCGEPLSVTAASAEDAHLLSEPPAQGVLAAKLRSLQGRLIHCELSFSPMIGEGETLEGFSVIVRDSGSRADLEESLQALVRKYRDMALAGSDWFWEVDSTGTYTFVCPEVEDFLGYTPEELFGTSAFDLMPPEEGQRVASIFNRIASRGIPFRNLLNTVLTRSGEVRTVASSGVPLLDSRGGLRGYRGVDREVVTGRDVPWEEETELETLRRITGKLPFPAAVIENTGRIRKVSGALCELMGRTPEQLVGRMYETVLSRAPGEGTGQCWNSARWRDHIPSPGGMIPVEKNRVPMDSPGSRYCLEILIPSPAVSFTAEARTPAGVPGVHEGFLSSLATALGGIAGFADILENGAPGEEHRRELIDMLRHHSSAVYRTLGSIRNYFEYTSGQFTTGEELFLPGNLTTQVLDSFRPEAKRRKILLKVQVERSLLGLWSGPFRGIRTIIFHILNCLSPSCEVLLGVSEVDSSGTGSIFRFSLTVSPTVSMSALNGPGGLSGATGDFQETLARCGDFACKLGGELLTGTTPSGGFRVWADIPLAGPFEPPRFKGRMNAMVLSGNPHMTVLYSRMLESLGCEVPPAKGSSPVGSALSILRDGSDASFLFFDADSVLKGAKPLEKPEEMPGCAGLNIHKVLLASRVKPGDIQGSLARGFSALLLKPVRLGRLGACLQLAASSGKGPGALITDNSFSGEN